MWTFDSDAFCWERSATEVKFDVRFVSPFNPKSKSGATSLLQTAENLNRTVRWRDPFFPELCGSVTFGCGIGANAAQSAFIAPCFRGVGL